MRKIPKTLKPTGFGIIEIDKGSKKLEKYLDQNPRLGTPTHTVKVLIEAKIDDVFSTHDGVGQEFSFQVTKFEVLDD